MSYPIANDELISRDNLLKGMSDEFNDIHEHIKRLRLRPRKNSKIYENPHKITKYIHRQMNNLVHNYNAEYNGNLENPDCEGNGNHILTRAIGESIYACELCDEVFEIYVIKGVCE
jgi:hypothetical protein